MTPSLQVRTSQALLCKQSTAEATLVWLVVVDRTCFETLLRDTPAQAKSLLRKDPLGTLHQSKCFADYDAKLANVTNGNRQHK